MNIIHPSKIADNPYQVRADYGDVLELAERIEAKREDFPETRGLMQVPIGRLVYADGSAERPAGAALAGCLQLIAREGMPSNLLVQLAFGHRRLRAFRTLCDRDPARFDGMPVNIVDLNDDQMLDAVWSENRERKEISAVEEAELLARKLVQVRAEGGSQREVAEAWGVSRPTVANRLRLLELPHELQAANRAGALSERQLLALAPVVKLMELARSTKWNEGPNAWEGPKSPERFIEQVLDNPEMTSDAIREYVKRAQQYAGQEIPEALATVALDMAGTVQPLCAGCSMRINQFCLNRSCFDRKVIAFGDRAAALLAEELGARSSGGRWVEPDHKQPRYVYGERVSMLVAAGLTENLMLAWTMEPGQNYAAPDWTWSQDRWEADGRYGVVWCHRQGMVTDAEFEAARELVAMGEQEAAAAAEGPGTKVINAWYEQSKLLSDVIREQLYRELQERTSHLAGSFLQIQPLLASLMHASFDKFLGIGDPGETLAAIVDHAWSNAYLKNDSAVQLAVRAERMGIAVDQDVVALSELLLGLYSFYRDSWGNKRVAERLLAANERWMSPEFDGRAYGLLPDLGQSLDGWLTKAVVKAQARLEEVEEDDRE